MTRRESLNPEFVNRIPDILSSDVLYVSVFLATAVHQCCCGCGNEVVTPLSPTGWSLTFDGKSVSLSPSVGNWGFQCRSHYWIRCNRVIWATPWTRKRGKKGRRRNFVAEIRRFIGKTFFRARVEEIQFPS